MNDNHHHHDHLPGLDQGRLKTAFLIVVSMMLLEIIAGYISGSIALTSDGYHMFVDAFALGIAYWAARVAHKNKRAETRAARTNGIILILMSLYILGSSYDHYFNHENINCQLMIFVATVGFFVNLIQFFILRKGDLKNINIRGAFFHVISDALTSLGVIGGGIIIYFYGWQQIDPILGFIIALTVFKFGFNLVRKSIKPS